MGPETLATVGVGSMAASSLGAVASGYSKSASDKYNAQVALNNANVATENAAYVAAEGNQRLEAQGLKNRNEAGLIRTNQAASGIDVNSGSAANVQASANMLGQLDALTMRSEAARKAYGFETEAANDKAQAGLYKSAAKKDVTAGYIDAGTSLLSKTATMSASGVFDAWKNKGAINSDSIGEQDGPYDNSLPWRNIPTGA